MSKPCVLLLEDDKWLANSLTSILSPEFEMRVCYDPEEVFGVLASWRPDVLLADVLLGTKNLFVLLNEMQSYVDTRDLNVVILSTIANEIDPRDVEKFSIREILNKAEITPQVLREALHKIANGKGSTNGADA